MDTPDDVLGFNRKDADKLIELIGGGAGVHIENIPQDKDHPHAWLAKSTGTITARSGTTLGSGTARLQKVAASVTSDYVESDGATVYDFTALNLTTTAISSGVYFVVYREFVTGNWIVASNSIGCTNPINNVYLDGLSLKQARCDGTIETIYTGTEC
jgi:hypothetical protein